MFQPDLLDGPQVASIQLRLDLLESGQIHPAVFAGVTVYACRPGAFPPAPAQLPVNYKIQRAENAAQPIDVPRDVRARHKSVEMAPATSQPRQLCEEARE
eukprot:6954291-Pyramimonas_sp.AAC.1